MIWNINSLKIHLNSYGTVVCSAGGCARLAHSQRLAEKLELLEGVRKLKGNLKNDLSNISRNQVFFKAFWQMFCACFDFYSLFHTISSKSVPQYLLYSFGLSLTLIFSLQGQHSELSPKTKFYHFFYNLLTQKKSRRASNMNKEGIQTTENVWIPRQKYKERGITTEQEERNCWEKKDIQNSHGLQLNQEVGGQEGMSFKSHAKFDFISFYYCYTVSFQKHVQFVISFSKTTPAKMALNQ